MKRIASILALAAIVATAMCLGMKDELNAKVGKFGVFEF